MTIIAQTPAQVAAPPLASHKHKPAAARLHALIGPGQLLVKLAA
jgi:hypothetical protein